MSIVGVRLRVLRIDVRSEVHEGHEASQCLTLRTPSRAPAVARVYPICLSGFWQQEVEGASTMNLVNITSHGMSTAPRDHFENAWLYLALCTTATERQLIERNRFPRLYEATTPAQRRLLSSSSRFSLFHATALDTLSHGVHPLVLSKLVTASLILCSIVVYRISDLARAIISFHSSTPASPARWVLSENWLFSLALGTGLAAVSCTLLFWNTYSPRNISFHTSALRFHEARFGLLSDITHMHSL